MICILYNFSRLPLLSRIYKSYVYKLLCVIKQKSHLVNSKRTYICIKITKEQKGRVNVSYVCVTIMMCKMKV